MKRVGPRVQRIIEAENLKEYPGEKVGSKEWDISNWGFGGGRTFRVTVGVTVGVGSYSEAEDKIIRSILLGVVFLLEGKIYCGQYGIVGNSQDHWEGQRIIGAYPTRTIAKLQWHNCSQDIIFHCFWEPQIFLPIDPQVQLLEPIKHWLSVNYPQQTNRHCTLLPSFCNLSPNQNLA